MAARSTIAGVRLLTKNGVNYGCMRSRDDLPACIAVLLVGDERPKELVERLSARLSRSKMDKETVGQLLICTHTHTHKHVIMYDNDNYNDNERDNKHGCN